MARKKTGFGAFAGMLLGGVFGLIFGVWGVVVFGVIGAFIGDFLEGREVKKEGKKI